MNKVIKNVSFAFLLLKMCIIFGQESEPQKRIVIDVGHGGKDSGAVGINGIQEKEIVLEMALEILKVNERMKSPFDIYLTRYQDTLISLSDRAKLSKVLNADLFISLHCNHSENPRANGVEIFVYKTASAHTKQSIWCAYHIQRAFKKQLGLKSRGIKFANFQVLRETAGYSPATLLELGFLSNVSENNYYSSPTNILLTAFTIHQSLVNLN